MRVVINTIPLLSPLTGIGKYTWQICRAMEQIAAENDYTYYYGYFSPRLYCAGQGKAPLAKVKDVLKNIPYAGRALRLLKGAGARVGQRRFDVYFEPNYVPLVMPATKTIVAIPDFSPILHPEWHKREMVEYFRGNFAKNIGRADRIIAISDFIRDAAIGEFGFDPAQVTTIHLGFDSGQFFPRERPSLDGLRKKYRLPERFILYVGSIEPRKNLLRLLKAYRQLSPALRNEAKLVLAGFRGWDNAKVMALLQELRQDVTYLGYVDEEDLAGLYNLAEIFVYPALYEGFGLPPLEAMACGCPVMVSQVASLPEVCGEAAYYVDPLDVDSISHGLAELLGDTDRLNLMRQAGLVRSNQFSWQKSAREHLQIFAM